MAYPVIPAKPAYRQRWDGWADQVDAAMRELVVDVPANKTAVTAATTRVSQAETAVTALQGQQALTASNASTALSTAQTAAASAASAQTAAQTAQGAATQAGDGRMAPPGRPKMASTPSISRLWISALPPLVG